MFNLNPIEVLKQREVKILPVHFSKSKISDSEFFEEILQTGRCRNVRFKS
jgi:hypothetical protein